MSYAGDYATGGTIYDKFTTRQATGVPSTLAGTPVVSIYKDGSVTQSTTGVTLTADFDGITGLNHIAIDTSADPTFYSNGSQFSAVITTGTVNSISVIGEVVSRFTLKAQSVVQTGDSYARIGAPAGASVSADIAQIYGVVDTEIAAIKTKTDFLPSILAGNAGGLFIAGSNAATTANITGNITGNVSGSVGSVTGNVGGNVTGSVGSIATGGINSGSFASGAIDNAAIATDAIGSAELAASAVTEIQTGLASATNLATLQTTADAIKTKTDNLPADPADASVIAGRFDTVDADIAAVQTTANAIDTKTTNLPSDPADESLIIAATDAIMNRIGAPTGANLSADVYSVIATLGAPTGANLSSDIAAIKTVVDTINTNVSAIDVPTVDDIVNEVWAVDMSAITGAADRSPLQAIRVLRNKISTGTGTFVVKQEDDTTDAWTGSISTDGSALPITGMDPA